MLTISETMWQQVLTEAQAAIDRWNARCVGDYAKYAHELKIEDAGEIVMASAIQHHSGDYLGPETINRLAWRKSDGALLKVKIKREGKTGRSTFMGQTITAKNWAAAAKSPKDLLNVSKLVDFFMIGKAYAMPAQTIGSSAG